MNRFSAISLNTKNDYLGRILSPLPQRYVIGVTVYQSLMSARETRGKDGEIKTIILFS